MHGLHHEFGQFERQEKVSVRGQVDAVIDHGVIRGNTVTEHYGAAVEILKALSGLGISLDDVTTELEIDGVKKFAQAWDELLENVRNAQQS